MEQKKRTMLVDVDVVNDAIQKLKKVESSLGHDLKYKCYEFDLENYLDTSKELYETIHLIKDLEVSLERFNILEQYKQSN